MSYQLIREGLQKIGDVTSWEAQLIKYNHKTHPNEFTCYTMNFATPRLLANVIDNMEKAYLHVVEVFNEIVEGYTGFNSKKTIVKLSLDNTVIQNSWATLIQRIGNSDDTTPLSQIKADAIVFIGTHPDGNGNIKNLYLLSKKNPILSFKKAAIFSGRSNTVSEIGEPLVQFNKCFDALIYNNVAYMINENCESIFNMEYSHKMICNKRLNELQNVNIIQDFEAFRKYATSKQNPIKFYTYDNEVVKILQTPTGQNLISEKIGIPLNTTSQQFDLNNPTNAKWFISIICGRAKKDLFGEGFCEVPSSIPLNHA